MVKTLTNCNMTWKGTVRMNTLLCKELGHLGFAFPTPAQVVAASDDGLQERCKLGYRTAWVVDLARKFCAGDIDPAWFERPDAVADELRVTVMANKGFGRFASFNVLQLLGHHEVSTWLPCFAGQLCWHTFLINTTFALLLCHRCFLSTLRRCVCSVRKRMWPNRYRRQKCTRWPRHTTRRRPLTVFCPTGLICGATMSAAQASRARAGRSTQSKLSNDELIQSFKVCCSCNRNLGSR